MWTVIAISALALLGLIVVGYLIMDFLCWLLSHFLNPPRF